MNKKLLENAVYGFKKARSYLGECRDDDCAEEWDLYTNLIDSLLLCLSNSEQETNRNTRQRKIIEWANNTFGKATGSNTGERISRFVEEALELAQAAGMDRTSVLSLVDYVYSRPVGEIQQEMGGVGVSLLAFAEHMGISADEAEHDEFIRVTSKDAAHFQARQNAKANAGVGLASSAE
jgi:NTP pyrophosphatase (non-canonical NTP hydrolase)